MEIIFLLICFLMISCTGPKIIQINLEKYPPIIKEFNEVLNKYARYSYTDNDIILLSDIELNRIIRIYKEMYLDKEIYYEYCNEIEKAMRDSLEKTVKTDELFYAADPRGVRLKLQKTIESKKSKVFFWVLKSDYISRVKVLKKYSRMELLINENPTWHRPRYIVQKVDELKSFKELTIDTLDIGSHFQMDNLEVGSEYILVFYENKNHGEFDCTFVDQKIIEGKIKGDSWDMIDYNDLEKFKVDFRYKFMID